MSSRNVFNFIKKNRLTLLVLLFLFIPPYTSKGYALSEVLQLNVFILTRPIKYELLELYPIFNVLALLMLFSSLTVGKYITPLFSWYASLSYILFAIVQNVSITDEYGVAICLSNIALFLMVSASWFYELKSRENDFSVRAQSTWRWLVLLPALLAIWQPVDPLTMGPDFNPLYLLNSGSGLTFCMMTTVYLALLIYFYPRVNLITLRITSMIGLLLGLGNLWLEWIYLPQLWWVGILHMPLVLMSGCGLWLSFRVRN
jgi:hypothetical protein